MATTKNATKVEAAEPSRFTKIKEGAGKALASDNAKTVGHVAASYAALGLAVFVGKLAWDAADKVL